MSAAAHQRAAAAAAVSPGHGHASHLLPGMQCGKVSKVSRQALIAGAAPAYCRALLMELVRWRMFLGCAGHMVDHVLVDARLQRIISIQRQKWKLLVACQVGRHL